MLAASAIGTMGLVFVARAFSATTRSALALWLARGLAFFGLAMSRHFPAVLFGETRFAGPHAVRAIAAEFDVGVVGVVLAFVPALVALRWPLPASLLYVASAIWGGANGAFDPFGAFPDRDVTMSILVGVVPPLVVAAAFLYASRGRAVTGAEFGQWLRSLVGMSATASHATI
jgi:hypothetical protein